MIKSPLQYSIGDMVVHNDYGVGYIDAIETKPINGVGVECFKVATGNGTYWFPTERIDNPRIHAVASHEKIQNAIEILRSAPSDSENDPLQWKERIEAVEEDGSFLETSKLVRDLAAYKAKKNIRHNEVQALKQYEARLLREWAASMNLRIDEIRPTLAKCLQESQAHTLSG